jgi:hypothetical protein
VGISATGNIGDDAALDQKATVRGWVQYQKNSATPWRLTVSKAITAAI